MSTVYLNGDFVPSEEASISVDDRAFLFGDGIYEVTPAYRGALFGLDRHLARMKRGLCELRLDFDANSLVPVHRHLLDANDLRGEEAAIVYLQVTRGAAPRTHAFPSGEWADTKPTVYGFAKEYRRPPRERWERGFDAITTPDRRWARVDIKTINLLPNCMAQQAAVDAGVSDAILVRDGMAVEGSHSNFFAVFGGRVVTHPATNVILPGITRAIVLDLCEELGIPVDLRPIQLEELWRADEAFFTGTTTEVKPTVRIDGKVVGEGKPGPVTRALSKAFLEATDRVAEEAGSPATA